MSNVSSASTYRSANAPAFRFCCASAAVFFPALLVGISGISDISGILTYAAYPVLLPRCRHNAVPFFTGNHSPVLPGSVRLRLAAPLFQRMDTQNNHPHFQLHAFYRTSQKPGAKRHQTLAARCVYSYPRTNPFPSALRVPVPWHEMLRMVIGTPAVIFPDHLNIGPRARHSVLCYIHQQVFKYTVSFLAVKIKKDFSSGRLCT